MASHYIIHLLNYLLFAGADNLRLTLKGSGPDRVVSVSNENISVTDIRIFETPDGRYGLQCTHVTDRYSSSARFGWKLNGNSIPFTRSYNNETDYLGWTGTGPFREVSGIVAYLQRSPSATATEGLFSCRYFARRIEYRVSIAVYYQISSVRGEIEVVSRRGGTFRVRCTSKGGKTLTMSVSGPRYSSEGGDKMAVKSTGTTLGLGNDSYTAITNIISGGDNGDEYDCTASNGLYAKPTSSVVLKVTSDPVITRMTQTSETSVRVEWSQPSGGSTVTGYVVHYSDGISERNESVPAFSTTFEISGLSPGIIYNISVEATSDHLSGESTPHRLCSSDVTEDIFTCSDISSNLLEICTKASYDPTTTTTITVVHTSTEFCSMSPSTTTVYVPLETTLSKCDHQSMSDTEGLSQGYTSPTESKMSLYTGVILAVFGVLVGLMGILFGIFTVWKHKRPIIITEIGMTSEVEPSNSATPRQSPPTVNESPPSTEDVEYHE